MLADPIAKLSLYRQGFGFVLGLLPALQAYAGAFFAIPLVRAFADSRRNAQIDDRNEARLEVSGLGFFGGLFEVGVGWGVGFGELGWGLGVGVR